MSAPGGYRHSELFAKLKNIQETIPHNLTSIEYLSTLDRLLERSLSPIISSTRFVNTFLSKVLAFQSKNPKRKTTAEGKRVLPSYVVLYLVSSDPVQKIDIYKKIGFDRGITMEMIRRWLDVMKQYETIVNTLEPSLEDLKRLKQLEVMVGVYDHEYPYGAYLQTKFWFENANFFKSMILEKYTRMCLKTAQQDYVKLGYKIDLEDILQVYLMAASKAIDKCDSNKGVLTTHIQHWLKSAKNVVMKNYLDGHKEGSSPSSNSELIEKFISDHDISAEANPSVIESVEDKLERQGTIDRVRQIAKIVDPKGYGRLILGIGEYLTPLMESTLFRYASPEPVK